jgi:ATP-dependent RNA helicase DHX29
MVGFLRFSACHFRHHLSSGKSTQVPTYILEDQLSKGKQCKIYCTEPRRISAISLAQRVSRELGDLPGALGTPSSLVGYSIRLESITSKSTRLTFATNGIALRMLEGGSGPGGQGMAFDEITVSVIDYLSTGDHSVMTCTAYHHRRGHL